MQSQSKFDLNSLKVAIASKTSLKQNLLAKYLKENLKCQCSFLENITELDDAGEWIPNILLWDIYSFKPEEVISSLKDFCHDIDCPIGLLDLPHSFGLEPMALRLKVKGFFYDDDPLSILSK